VRTSVLASGVALLALVGAVGGYYGGARYDDSTRVNETAPIAPLTGPSSDPPLPKKTPEPNSLPALKASELKFHTQGFTIYDKSGAPVKLSIRVPRGWVLSRDPKTPQEVRFRDPKKERWVRVESALQPSNQSTADWMNQLVANLKSSQPYENDLQILSDTTDPIESNGLPRTVSTLTYTYIPTKTLRYVIVRWIATGGDDLATVEMSITGLPQDATALKSVALEAARSVTEPG
jgi:hypothetical protein